MGRARASTRTDEDRLRQFCEVVTDAENRRAIMARTVKGGFTLRWDKGAGMSTETQLGDPDDAHALMLDLRKILMPGEDVYFPRIAGIVHQAARDAELQRDNARNRELWKIVMTEGVVEIDEGAGPHRTPEAWFDLVVNGEVFHTDAAAVDGRRHGGHRDVGQYPKLALVFHSVILVMFAGFFVVVLPKSRFTAAILGLAVLVTASTLVLNTRSAMRNGWRGAGDEDSDDDEQEPEAALARADNLGGPDIAVEEAKSDAELEAPDNVGDPS